MNFQTALIRMGYSVTEYFGWFNDILHIRVTIRKEAEGHPVELSAEKSASVLEVHDPSIDVVAYLQTEIYQGLHEAAIASELIESSV